MSSTRYARRWLKPVIVGFAAVAALPTTGARAADVAVEYTGAGHTEIGRMTFTARPGEPNRVTITQTGGDLTVREDGAPLTAGSGCTSVSATEAVCHRVTQSAVDLGDGDDSLTLHTTFGVEVGGGDGDDRIDGGTGDDRIFGGPGNDVMTGGEGNDTFTSAGDHGDNTIDGGGGNDEFDIGLGNDTIVGGPGVDTVSFGTLGFTRPGITATLGGTSGNGAPRQSVAIAADVENLAGGPGNDLLTGDGGPNRIAGGGGSDRIVGRAGDDALEGDGGDVLDGGDGNDALDARSDFTSEEGSSTPFITPAADQLSCGLGVDSVIGDFLDRILPGCESIDRGPKVVNTRARMTSRARVGIRFRCGSPRPCRLNAVLRAPGLTRMTAFRSITVPAGGSTLATLRMSHAGAALVRRKRTVRASLVAIGEPGIVSAFTVLAP